MNIDKKKMLDALPDIFFRGSWLSLLGYCAVTNLHHWLLGKSGTGGYPGAGMVLFLEGSFFFIFAISFPLGTILKGRTKGLWLWLVMILGSSLILCVSDVWGIPNPFVDDYSIDDPLLERFWSSWCLHTGILVVGFGLILLVCYCWFLVRDMITGKKSKPYTPMKIVMTILLLLFFATQLVTMFYQLFA